MEVQSSCERSGLLEQLIEEHYESALRMLTRLSGSAAVAEDLVQTWCAGLLASWRPLDTSEENRRYLLRAAYNTWYHWTTQCAAAPAESPLEDDVPATDDSPFDVISLEEEVEMLRAAMKLLPHNHRAVLVLIVLRGMSYNEVAEIMGASRDTIATWRTRALSRIEKILLEGPPRSKDVA
jgi:RNA polymerase sigma-70 factor (ECF subfamily)